MTGALPVRSSAWQTKTSWKKVGGFAADATVDTAADGFINNAVDGVASHIPGGAMAETVMKTGIDFEANSLINGELGKVEGMFGQHEEPAAQ